MHRFLEECGCNVAVAFLSGSRAYTREHALVTQQSLPPRTQVIAGEQYGER
jgi:hypothetical protein